MSGTAVDIEHRAAARVGVHLGDDDARALDGVVEVLRERDRLLAGHRVDDDQHLGGVDLVGKLGELVGEVVVEGDRAAGVDDHGGRAAALRLGERALADLRRGRLALLGVDGHADLVAEHAQLLGGGGALEVGRDEERAQALLLQVQGEAPGERRLAGALHAADEDLRRPLLGAQQGLLVAPEDLDELVVDDADDLLAGGDRLQHLGAVGPLAHARDEVADDAEVDVGLEQRDAHLAQGGIEVGLGDASAAAEPGEGGLESFAEGVKHGRGSVTVPPATGARARCPGSTQG